MKKALFIICGFIMSLLAAPKASAQLVYDVSCPVGTSVVNQTSNNSNGHVKAYVCVDPFGTINMPQTIVSSNGAPVGSCQSSAQGVITAVDFLTGNWYTCGASTWHAISGGAAPGAPAGSIQFNQGGVFTGTAATLKCNSGMAGADLGAKINTCTAALPVGGGLADVSELRGAQTLSTAVVIPAGVTLLFGANTQVSQSATVTASNAGASVKCPEDKTAVFTKAASLDQFTLSAANTRISFCTLAGAGGSFTGRGIVASAANTIIEYNNVSGEAGNAIDGGASGALVQFNVVTGGTVGSGSHAISIGNNGTVSNNNVTSTVSDTVVSVGNSTLIDSNVVSLNPLASTSGLCAINFNADQIGSRSHNNLITINDSTNSGNVDKGVCDTPTGTHNMNMRFEGDRTAGVVSGSVSIYCSVVNNAANLNTNWVGVTFRDEACVHAASGASYQDLDTQGNSQLFEDPEIGDTAIVDGTTTGAGTIWSFHNFTLPFASLPALTISGNGSQIFCSNCTATTPVLTGGIGSLIIKTNGQWNGIRTAAYTFGQISPLCNAAAASCTQSFTNHTVPGDAIVVSVDCNQAASPTIAVTDSTNTYTAIPGTLKQNPSATFWNQLFLASGTVPGGSFTVTTSGNACTNTSAYATSYRTLLPVSPTDVIATAVNGTGTSASITITGSNGDMTFFTVDNHASCNSTGSPAGWTSRTSGVQTISVADNTMPLAGTLTPAWTCSSGDWIANAVSFKINQ